MQELNYYKVLKSIKDANQPKVLDDLLSMQLFVITDDINGVVTSTEHSDEPLNLPFPNMIFEVLGTDFLIGVIERTPCEYTMYRVDKKRDLYEIRWTNKDKDMNGRDAIAYDGLKAVIRRLLDTQINVKNYSTEINPKTPLMVKKKGSSKNKKKAIPTSSVIIISKTKSSSRLKKLMGRAYELTCSFMTRGTWRGLFKRNPDTGKFDKSMGIDMTRIGKNRDKQRCVLGYTWVKEHPKGDGPMRDQIRIVK